MTGSRKGPGAPQIPAAHVDLERSVPVTARLDVAVADMVPEGAVAVVGASHRAEELAGALAALGLDVTRPDSAEAVTDPSLAGLVDARALDDGPVEAATVRDHVVGTFDLARAVDARPEGFAVVALTSLDGRHGFGGVEVAPGAPLAAAVAGFWKGAAKEWRRHRVRCLDVAPALDVETIARHAAAELAGAVPGDELEHGLDDNGLWGVEAIPLPVDATRALAADAVVLAVGGAQGIGADILAGCVAAAGRTVVIAGRTDPDDVEEPEGLAADAGETEIRAALIAQFRDAGERPVPATVERTLRRIVGARRVRATVAGLEASGATVEYHALDARDPEAVAALVASVIEDHGRVDLVLHAAGVIDDAPVARKDRDGVAGIVDTKVIPALALCDAVPATTTVVFFGSVAGRFGNASQSDYGAANEFLAKLALVRRRAGADVRCIAWGPWDSGMVSAGLLAAYDALGIVPISTTQGVDAFARELTDAGAAEVVLANSTQVMAGLRWPPTAASILGS